MKNTAHPFDTLTPGFIMDAVESRGFRCDCRTLALNSYENRVYQVGIEEGTPLIAKFYRPGRWSDAQILEEHRFCLELAEHELPVVAPWAEAGGDTLFRHEGFRFALYPRQGGHAPEFDNLDNLEILGRMLGRIHRVGAVRPFVHRPAITIETFGREGSALIRERFIPEEYRESYAAVVDRLLERIEAVFAETGPVRSLRCHGDCHSGNLIHRPGESLYVLDFDDMVVGPPVQDVWMLLPGPPEESAVELDLFMEGYETFRSFDATSLKLIEPLRAMRFIHYTAWCAHQVVEDGKTAVMVDFGSRAYWQQEIDDLRDQLHRIEQGPPPPQRMVDPF